MIVTINGRERVITRRALSYARIVDLAFVGPPQTVTYRVRGGEHGALGPGDVIAVSEGLSIEVVAATEPSSNGEMK